MPDKKLAQEIINLQKELIQQRNLWDVQYKDISDYLLPHRGYFTTRGDQPNQGRKKGSKVLDNTAGRALRVLAAGMQGGMTSPARAWFKLTLQDPDLAAFRDIKLWLGEVERRMYSVFAKSNFYSTVHSVYSELGGFGTACQYIEEDDKSTLRARIVTVGNYVLSTDAAGRINTVIRTRYLTVSQLKEKFGEDKLSPAVQQMIKANDLNKHIPIIHCVRPRDKYRDGTADPKLYPWQSVYIEQDEAHLISESGYREFPFQAPRWDVRGPDIYGYSPGMETIDDIKMLQEMQKTSLKQLHKMLDPPMNVPEGYRYLLSLVPGGINYVPENYHDAVKPTLQVQPDIKSSEYKIEKIKESIREGFFNDLFLMLLEHPNMTATEVLQRKEEKMLMLGPVVERQESGYLNPTIDRAFAICFRKGLFPPIPSDLAAAIQEKPDLGELKVEYVGVLSQAQKLSGVNAIAGMVDFIGHVAQAKPNALDKLDEDEAIDRYANMTGVPAKIIRSAEEVQKIRQVRADQQRKLEEQQQLAADAQTGKTAAEGASHLAKTDPDALKRMLSSIGIQ